MVISRILDLILPGLIILLFGCLILLVLSIDSASPSRAFKPPLNNSVPHTNLTNFTNNNNVFDGMINIKSFVDESEASLSKFEDDNNYDYLNDRLLSSDFTDVKHSDEYQSFKFKQHLYEYPYYIDDFNSNVSTANCLITGETYKTKYHYNYFESPNLQTTPYMQIISAIYKDTDCLENLTSCVVTFSKFWKHRDGAFALPINMLPIYSMHCGSSNGSIFVTSNSTLIFHFEIDFVFDTFHKDSRISTHLRYYDGRGCADAMLLDVDTLSRLHEVRTYRGDGSIKYELNYHLKHTECLCLVIAFDNPPKLDFRVIYSPRGKVDVKSYPTYFNTFKHPSYGVKVFDKASNYLGFHYYSHIGFKANPVGGTLDSSYYLKRNFSSYRAF